MIYIDVKFIIQKQCHTVISLILGDTTNLGGFWFPLFEVEILVFCVEALCKLQSVLVPLTLAIGVLVESFFLTVWGGKYDGMSVYQKHDYVMKSLFFSYVAGVFCLDFFRSWP